MRLSHIKLAGFKSFVDPTHIALPGQLVGIVGPNGCGKSNISDAIAWVLGEQSARLLRSQNMADVIFAGSPDRPPLGAAQVSLALASPDGRWPETEGTLQISRRVLRDGTSEYRLRGRRVRLKDVMELLGASGLARRTYAVIGQGLVDQALSLRPEERRELFEEAAGISLYQSKRDETLRKLDDSQRNLERVARSREELIELARAGIAAAGHAPVHVRLTHRHGCAVVELDAETFLFEVKFIAFGEIRIFKHGIVSEQHQIRPLIGADDAISDTCLGLNLERQRTVGGCVEVADVARHLEQVALAGKHRESLG